MFRPTLSILIILICVAQLMAKIPIPASAGRYVLQSGGSQITQQTVADIGNTVRHHMPSQKWRNMLDALKAANGLAPDFEGKIWSNADYSSMTSDETIDNILNHWYKNPEP